MRTLYAVVSGEYSDFSVHCLCPTKEIAEAVAEKYNTREPHSYTAKIAEYALIESPDEAVKSTCYYVLVSRDGAESRRWSYTRWPWEVGDDDAAVGFPPDGIRGHSTRSYEVALKAARDHLAKRKAAQAGI